MKSAIEICKAKDNIEFVLLGDGPYFKMIENLIIQNSLTNKIKLLGWSDNIAEELRKSHLFVLSSLHAGLPLSILEAMGCGLACAVTNIPGNNNLVINNYNGLLFETRNVTELTNIITKYYVNRELLKKHASNSRKLAVDKYDLNKRNKQIFELYN